MPTRRHEPSLDDEPVRDQPERELARARIAERDRGEFLAVFGVEDFRLLA
jgi:hypothetical protein